MKFSHAIHYNACTKLLPIAKRQLCYCFTKSTTNIFRQFAFFFSPEKSFARNRKQSARRQESQEEKFELLSTLTAKIRSEEDKVTREKVLFELGSCIAKVSSNNIQGAPMKLILNNSNSYMTGFGAKSTIQYIIPEYAS